MNATFKRFNMSDDLLLSSIGSGVLHMIGHSLLLSSIGSGVLHMIGHSCHTCTKHIPLTQCTRYSTVGFSKAINYMYFSSRRLVMYSVKGHHLLTFLSVLLRIQCFKEKRELWYESGVKHHKTLYSLKLWILNKTEKKLSR